MSTLNVATSGTAAADGSRQRPYRSITAACAQAQAGDTIIIHSGTYRECIDLPRGGNSDTQRITLQAAPDATVTVSGADPLCDWEPLAGGLWQCVVPDELFPAVNTLRTELGGDWFWHKHVPQRLGQLFFNQHEMLEVADRASVAAAAPWPEAKDPSCGQFTWCVEEATNSCRIIAHFAGAQPSDHHIELSTRTSCLAPSRTGINWITVQGIEFCRAAAPWAPPTAEQIGMLMPNWSKGWIIEDCHLHHARCSAISLGAPAFIGDNRWTHEQVKHGTQREREVVFTALHHGWSRETIGSHIVRRCHIHDCEQTAICGHLGAIWSVIEDNHIHHIHHRRRFGGHEMAGIKLHAGIDVRIAGNHIHDCIRGIWMDWQAQGARIHNNLLYDNDVDDFYIEVSHGPTIVDHNIFLSSVAVKNCSQGTAFVHNLIGGAVTMQPIPIRYTPYHLHHSTQVMGLMTILGGDDHWLNNLFIAPQQTGNNATVEDENADLDKAGNQQSAYGLGCYDDWPTAADDWMPKGGVPAYAAARLPVAIHGNCFSDGTHPGQHAQGSPNITSALAVTRESGANTTSLRYDVDVVPHVRRLAADCLGNGFQAECPFDDPNGQLVSWEQDTQGQSRSSTTPAGPFANMPQRSWPAFSAQASTGAP